MLGIDSFWLSIGGVFVGSMALGFLTVKFLRRRKQVPVPKLNAILRISTSGCVYRAHFIGERPGGWAFTPPLQRDGYVPIREGDYIIMETVMDQGVVVFKTTVKERSTTPPMLVAERPTFWHVEDRRDFARIEEIGHLQAKLDGDKVGLMDMSACGARIRSQARRAPGERVKLEVAGFEEPIHGFVLDSDRKGDRYITRLRFEEETDLGALVGV